MLGKLLKHDLKWVYKLIIIFYILALIFAIIGRGLISIENSIVFNILGKISIGISISMAVSSIINCLMRAWVRFVRNLYKDEAYLTHTLPVNKKTIYLSKVLTTIITVFTTVAVILLCLLICYGTKSNIESLKNILELAANTYNTTVINLILIISILMFIELFFIVLIGYVGIILGHKFNNNRMVKSVIIGFAFYMLVQVITLAIIYVIGLINPDVMNLVNTTENVDVNTIKILLYIAILIYSIYSVIFYFIGRNQLEKGVNVE